MGCRHDLHLNRRELALLGWVLGLFNLSFVGWSVNSRMTSGIFIDTLRPTMAWFRNKLVPS
jgi:hypothetical protein